MTTVLVTGANSGIGAAATAALLAAGAEVVATVRSGAAAAKVHKANPSDRLTVRLLDVTDADTAAQVIDQVRPDVVVNSAGDALLGAVVDIDDDAVRAHMESLVIGPMRLARLASVHQRERGSGRIINISSTTADATMPFTGWYGAAKAALDAATDALRLELAPAGIEVIRVECGAIRTPAWDEAGAVVENGRDALTASSRHRWAQVTHSARPFFADPDEVAAVIARAALDDDPPSVYRVGFGSRFGVLSNVLPTAITDRVKRAVFGLRDRT